MNVSLIKQIRLTLPRNISYKLSHLNFLFSLSNSAVIPDMLEKILPADGTKTVGELFYEVLEGIGKLQNFAVYMEGSRVPLDFNVDTSVLVGQKVLIKYLPGPCKFTSN